jgi:hypothetical protein
MAQKSYDISGGVGKLYLLFLLFLGLKLAGEIGWSWWWVTLPLWLIPAAAGALFFVAFLLGVFVKRTDAWRRAQIQSRYAARLKKGSDIDKEYEKS